MFTVKELVESGNRVRFVKYFNGELWYEVFKPINSGSDWLPAGFEFPVPISDIGNATFLSEDKAILFMRYIRKHLDMINAAKAE
jgi:hypothetical protein